MKIIAVVRELGDRDNEALAGYRALGVPEAERIRQRLAPRAG